MSAGGIGFLGGSLVMSIWGGPRKRILGILGFNLLQGVTLLAAGIPPRVVIYVVAVFFFFFGQPMINGCSQAIWQVKTAPDVQGRVFAMRRMIAWSSLPFSYLLAGPLADLVFKPLLIQGGPLANSVGRIIGIGPGRGIGLFFIIMGILVLVITVGFYLYPHLRHLEVELPDVITSKSPAPTAD
jgi:hypothetical protein